MKLSLLERLMILGLLPGEGDILLLRVRQGMIQKMGLSGEEVIRFDFSQNPSTGIATWRTDLPQDLEIEVSEVESGVVKDGLTKLNKANKLTPNHMTLYEKFVAEGGA